MVNAANMNRSQLPAGKDGKSTKKSTRPRHHMNDGKGGLEGEMLRVLGVSCSFRSKKKLLVENWQEMYFLSNKENEKWIKGYVERETAGARKLVPDAQTAMMQELQDMTTAENVGATTRKPETTFGEMLNAIGNIQSHLRSSDDE